MPVRDTSGSDRRKLPKKKPPPKPKAPPKSTSPKSGSKTGVGPWRSGYGRSSPKRETRLKKKGVKRGERPQRFSGDHELALHPRRYIPDYVPYDKHPDTPARRKEIERGKKFTLDVIKDETDLLLESDRANRLAPKTARLSQPKPKKPRISYGEALKKVGKSVGEAVVIAPAEDVKNLGKSFGDYIGASGAKIGAGSSRHGTTRETDKKANPTRVTKAVAAVATDIGYAKGASLGVKKVGIPVAGAVVKGAAKTPKATKAVTQAAKSGTIAKDAKKANTARKLEKAAKKDARRAERRHAVGKNKAVLTARAAGRTAAKGSGVAAVGGTAALTATKGVPTPGKTKAAGLQILEQSARPLHATAGLAVAGPKGFKEGALHNKNYTGSDIVKKVGLGDSAAARLGLGFAADVAFDPTSYAGIGVARKADLAFKAAEKKALKAGATAEKAAQAGREAAEKAGTGKVRTIDFGLASRPKRLKVKDKNPDGPIRTLTHPITRHLTPSMRAPGVDEAEHEAHVAAVRKGRAASTEQRQRAQAVDQIGRRKGRKVEKFSEDEQSQIIDALETDDIDSLPTDLQDGARQAKHIFGQTKKLERTFGVDTPDLVTPEERIARARAEVGFHQDLVDELMDEVGDKSVRTLAKTKQRALGQAQTRLAAAKKDLRDAVNEAPHSPRGYVYQIKKEKSQSPLDTVEPKKERGTLGAKHEAGFEKTRSDRRSVAAKRGTDEAVSENLYEILASRLNESARRIESQPVMDQLKRSGREFPVIGGKAAKGVTLGADEAVYRFEPRKAPHIINKSEAKPGDVILDRKHAKKVLERMAPLDPSKGAKVLDTLNRGFKHVVRLSPQYHMRNLYGDYSLSYQAGTTLKSIIEGAGMAKAYVKHKNKLRKNPTHRMVEVPNKPYKEMTREERVQEALDNGADLGGIVMGDVVEEAVRGGKRTFGSGSASAAREAGPRLATYDAARRRGLTPEEAVDWMHQHHPDYGDLTQFERVYGKRAYPFYTFTSRNLVTQGKKLATRPGRFAHFQALREEASKEAGLQEGWEGKDLQKYEQRGTPIPVKIGGKIQYVFPILPLNDISRFSMDPKELKDLGIGSVTPFVKTPLELATNHSFFFDREIKNKYTPKVPAPTWVHRIPESQRKKLGITTGKDRKTGKTIFLMPAGMKYATSGVGGPAVNQAIQFGSPGTKARGAAFALGPKFSERDPLRNEQKNLQKKLYEELDPKYQEARQENPKSKKTKRLAKQKGKTLKALRKNEIKQGYKNPVGRD